MRAPSKAFLKLSSPFCRIGFEDLRANTEYHNYTPQPAPLTIS